MQHRIASSEGTVDTLEAKAEIAIDIQHISKSYGKNGHKAVDDLSLQVKRGEVFGLLGPNGAGKTSLIAMLSTLLQPNSGSASLLGFDVQRQPREVQRRIGLVPQDLGLYPTLSCYDNLDYFASLQGLKGKQKKERCEAVLAMVQLQDRARSVVSTLSGGMKRRLNIAVGLVHEPEILFLDEPTVGVDPQSRNFIFDYVERLNARGMTIIYTSHYMEEVERLCQRVAIMDEGKLLALDNAATLVEQIGGGLLQLQLAHDVPDDSITALQGLEQVKEVQQQAHDRGGVTLSLYSAQPLELIQPATAMLEQPIQHLEVKQASLETVFLALTGKQLRD